MRKAKRFTAIWILALAFCIMGCSKEEEKGGPATWGYECTVTYDTLGGMINSREVRTTYYLPNSYLFEPGGASGMLVEPKKEGHILAGWYTAKTDITDSEGNVVGYEFKAEDRWDFNMDRVQGDMTLYARWIPQGVVNYYNAETGTVIFTKNITADSPVQRLSDAVLVMYMPTGVTLAGYYEDSECTKLYDFSGYQHVDLVTDDIVVYEQLAEEFPEIVVPYTAPEGEEEDNSIYRFLHQKGYDIITEDEAALTELFARYDEIIEDTIETYQSNTANRNLYLKFTDSSTVTVHSVEDLKDGSSYVLSGDVETYVISADLDFSGIDLTVAEDFSGKIEGNGHTISNLTLSYTSSKREKPGEKLYGLFGSMKDAEISDLNFENISVTVSPRLGVTLYAGLLAGKAENCKITNCTFHSVTVTTAESYAAGTTDIYLGDLFGSSENCTIEGCTVEDVTVNLEKATEGNLLLSSADSAE